MGMNSTESLWPPATTWVGCNEQADDEDEFDGDDDGDEVHDRSDSILMQIVRALTASKGSLADLADVDGAVVTGTLGPNGEFEVEQVIAADDDEQQAIAKRLFAQQVGRVGPTELDARALRPQDDAATSADEETLPPFETYMYRLLDPQPGAHNLFPSTAAWNLPNAGGVKDDAMKNRLDLIDPDFLFNLGAVLTHGARKYGDHNWRAGMPYARLYGALQRHLNAFWAGESFDPESGFDHLAHAACELMFLSWMHQHRPDLDDRWVEGEE